MSRSLWPREHGAYAQLAAPLAAGLLSRVPTAASGLFALAACAAFLVNEPLLVVLGHRGKRMHDEDGRRAVRRVALLVAVMVGAGCAGFVLGSADARLACSAPAVLGIALALLAWTRGQHSLFGELVAALALPAAAIPVAVASGEAIGFALWTSAAWSIGFCCSVVVIQRVIARRRKPPTRIDQVVTFGVACVGVAVLLLGFVVAAPLVLASLVVAMWAPPATRLRAIGVGLVCAAVAAGGVEVAIAHHAFAAPSPRPSALVAH